MNERFTAKLGLCPLPSYTLEPVIFTHSAGASAMLLVAVDIESALWVAGLWPDTQVHFGLG